MPLFDMSCEVCNHEFDELLVSYRYPNPLCPKCGGKTQRHIATPAFTFKEGHGRGTDGGQTMRMPGHRVPGGIRPSNIGSKKKKVE